MKISTSIRLVCLMLAISIFSIEAKAKTILVKDTVYGIVIDQNKNPIPGVKVEVEGQSEYAYTDVDGRFNIICGPDAKKVIVTFAKLPEITKKIRPNMEIKLDISGLSSPDHYQWFIGANAGISLVNIKPGLENVNDGFSYIPDKHKSLRGVNLSIMGGRVKDIGWYAKYMFSISDQFTVHGPAAGGIFRLGSPVYLCIGAGISMNELKNSRYSHIDYPKIGGLLDFGFLVRLKDNIGINCSGTLGFPTYCTDTSVTIAFGVSYFFNQ